MRYDFSICRSEDREAVCPHCERSTEHLKLPGEGVSKILNRDEHRRDPSIPLRWAVYHPECWDKARDQEVAGVCAGCKQAILEVGVVRVSRVEHDGVRRSYHIECEPKEETDG